MQIYQVSVDASGVVLLSVWAGYDPLGFWVKLGGQILWCCCGVW